MLALILAASTLLRIETTLGNIVVQLDPARAPKTTAGFLRCAESRYANRWTFYRVVRPGNQSAHRPIQVIQGGLDADQPPFPNLQLESTRQTGLRNRAGTIAIPRDTAPNTGSPCDFFINMVDNPLLDAGRSPDGYGYAVFGRVVSGMNVARRIEFARASGERGQYLSPKIRIIRIVPENAPR
jgi:peptidyl-prolyl cis-trans isomerase A (cyclophilin A)